jgi:lysophospholipase
MVALCIIRHSHRTAGLARLLRRLGFGRAFVPGGGETSIATLPFKGNRLTSDPVRYARNAHVAHMIGEGAIGAPTIAWLDSAFRFMKRFSDPRYALKIRLPTLVIAAGGDPVCATPATERFASRLKAGHAIVIPGARHEILMERDPIREQFWAAFDAFVPGSTDLGFEVGPVKPAESAAEQLDGGRMDTAVARRDDAPALGR